MNWKRKDVHAVLARDAATDPVLGPLVLGPSGDGTGIVLRPPTGSDVTVPIGDYVLFDGHGITTMAAERFEATHEPVAAREE